MELVVVDGWYTGDNLSSRSMSMHPIRLVCTALLYIAAQMVFGLIPRSVKRMRATSDDSARGLHWTVVLLHLTDPAKADRLLRAALDRSQHLTRANIRPDVAEGTHALMCLERAITTEEATAACDE